MKKYLTFYSDIAERYFYLEQKVRNVNTGKIGFVREIHPHNIKDSILVQFKAGKKLYKKNDILLLAEI